MDLSPTFDNEALTEKGNLSGAWGGARDEAIIVISNNPKIDSALKTKLLEDLRNGNFETRTTGSGTLSGQADVVQKYQNGKKVPNNTKEVEKCNPLKTNLCEK
ncbi:hypothetical protein ACSF86_04035 [Moraxella bovoculi]|uniref:hypothetical protein n=1 Tax=Moraxella bovoculi TaxID=386891 RepID=UPI003F506041